MGERLAPDPVNTVRKTGRQSTQSGSGCLAICSPGYRLGPPSLYALRRARDAAGESHAEPAYAKAAPSASVNSSERELACETWETASYRAGQEADHGKLSRSEAGATQVHDAMTRQQERCGHRDSALRDRCLHGHLGSLKWETDTPREKERTGQLARLRDAGRLWGTPRGRQGEELSAGGRWPKTAQGPDNCTHVAPNFSLVQP